MILKNTGYTLIETLVGVLIVSIVIIGGFQALSSIGVGKIKLIEQTKVEKQAYFASEKFFEMIKKGGTIDYEEYWNRSVFNISFTNGHYTERTGFGNFGDNRPSVGNTTYGREPYYCLSKLGDNMGQNGCLLDYNIRYGLGSANEDKRGPQRYMQYATQFIDRNSDEDGDGGDEDGDGSIVDDADDLFLGIGPKAFVNITVPSEENRVGELYFINSAGDERTFFRWRVEDDPYALTTDTCDAVTTPYNPIGDKCLGTIEFLKLIGRDYGYDHNAGTQDGDGSQGDGVIDTWLIHGDFTSDGSTPVAGSTATEYWQKIFPDSINVSGVEFYLYPNKDIQNSWRDSDISIQVAPYLQLKMTLQPSWKEKRKIKGDAPTVTIASTIQLSDLDFR